MTGTTKVSGSSMNAPTAGQARLVIVGTTGMVGGYALRYALEHAGVGTVTAIGRRKLGIVHSKLKEVLYQDFADCSALAEALSGQDAAIFCLGTYTGAVSDAELRKTTVDYTMEFARVLRLSSPDAAFSFLSGGGADPTGRSRIPYARYKGEAENALLTAGFSRVYIFRPAYIYPWSRGRNRISATACYAKCTLHFEFCSLTRSFGPMIWPERWLILPSGELASVEGWFSRIVTSEPWSSNQSNELLCGANAPFCLDILADRIEQCFCSTGLHPENTVSTSASINTSEITPFLYGTFACAQRSRRPRE